MAELTKPIIYITRDIERALGRVPSADYRIITNRTPFSENITLTHPGYVTLIENNTLLDTAELLEHEITIETITRLGSVDIVVFKNNSRIESIIKTHGWNLLNPSAATAETVENKITQVKWLGDIATEWLPPHRIKLAKDIIWEKQPLIVQWAHGHTGDSTILVNTEAELRAIQQKFPDRMSRVSIYINGPTFTANVVVGADKILVGNISYQITGIPPFTNSPFTTIGNDWSVAADIMNEGEIESIKTLAVKVGEKMRKDGWKGLFGIDVIHDTERNKLFLLEINARQPASTTFESFIQSYYRDEGLKGQTIFEAHLDALQDKTSDLPLIEVNDGAQVIQRITKKIHLVSPLAITSLVDAGFIVIPYKNTEENSDLLRIQSLRGIIEIHGKFNTRGKQIVELIEK